MRYWSFVLLVRVIKCLIVVMMFAPIFALSFVCLFLAVVKPSAHRASAHDSKGNVLSDADLEWQEFISIFSIGFWEDLMKTSVEQLLCGRFAVSLPQSVNVGELPHYCYINSGNMVICNSIDNAMFLKLRYGGAIHEVDWK